MQTWTKLVTLLVCARLLHLAEYIEDEDRPWYCAPCTASHTTAKRIARNEFA